MRLYFKQNYFSADYQVQLPENAIF